MSPKSHDTIKQSQDSGYWTWWLYTSLYVMVTASVFWLIHSIQPEPYLDEVFHIPQARRYCNGKFKEWDPKITTLPGLYVASVGILSPLSQFLERLCCDVIHLRLINVVTSCLIPILLHRITLQIHGDKQFYDQQKGLLSAFNLSLFPVLYFFSFLYYTDMGSTFLVLLMYSLHLDNHDWVASVLGSLAILFRQTNVVWVAFTATQAIGPPIIAAIQAKLYEQHKTTKFSLNTWGQLAELVQGLKHLLREPACLVQVILECLSIALGYILVGVAFVGFVLINKGVAVGDKDAHAINFHPTQVLYFSLFSAAFTWSYSLTKAVPFLTKFVRRHYLFVAFTGLMMASIVSSYTLAHPYLLADNRHYPFYFWRRIVQATSWSKYALVPLYIFSSYCLLYSLRRNGIMFKIFFPLVVFINLSPQLLLEFRYFIVPYLLYRLQIRPQTWWKLLGETALYLVVNVLTVYLFVARPFVWSHEPEAVQRFMW